MKKITKKEKFLQTYADLPIVARDEIVVVVDNEPMTWRSAKLEVDMDTPIGKKILEKLTKMDLLK